MNNYKPFFQELKTTLYEQYHDGLIYNTAEMLCVLCVIQWNVRLNTKERCHRLELPNCGRTGY